MKTDTHDPCQNSANRENRKNNVLEPQIDLKSHSCKKVGYRQQQRISSDEFMHKYSRKRSKNIRSCGKNSQIWSFQAITYQQKNQIVYNSYANAPRRTRDLCAKVKVYPQFIHILLFYPQNSRFICG